MAIVFLMLLVSCPSTKVIEKTVVPYVEFPEFPLAEEMTQTEEGVLVPNQWIVDLAEYQIRIEETEKVYKRLYELYGDENCDQ